MRDSINVKYKYTADECVDILYGCSSLVLPEDREEVRSFLMAETDYEELTFRPHLKGEYNPRYMTSVSFRTYTFLEHPDGFLEEYRGYYRPNCPHREIRHFQFDTVVEYIKYKYGCNCRLCGHLSRGLRFSSGFDCEHVMQFFSKCTRGECIVMRESYLHPVLVCQKCLDEFYSWFKRTKIKTGQLSGLPELRRCPDERREEIFTEFLAFGIRKLVRVLPNPIAEPLLSVGIAGGSAVVGDG